MRWLFEPGFLASPQVRTALVIGGITAVVSGIVGCFTVLRGQSFGGHAITDASATGGSGALLVGLNPLLGFVLGSIVGAGAIEAVGARHGRGRDLATGIVLGASIGLASLFLYLTTSTTATTGATQRVLFGSIFVTAPSTVPIVSVFGVISVAIIAVICRPLLLASVNADMATARGVPTRIIGIAYMAALALAVGLSSLAIGAVLSTALLIGPAAAALRLTKRMGRAVLVSCGLGAATTWVGVLLAYDSADWGSGHGALPVSFFIVALIVLAYLVSGLASRRPSRRRDTAAAAGGDMEATAARRRAADCRPADRRRDPDRPASDPSIEEHACSPPS
jgi:zinc/manganese transport system permease protein